ncbi:helix-turn-helix transcriptional regulator [Pedobacter sp. GSP4]|uniref:AraC family transcriptional regulator n=1 Tax=Pedobacter sp. GSP4 TaxID=3453716 RepID=UPI003EEABB24
MTHSGEETTIKGEYENAHKSVFLFNKAMVVSHSFNVEDQRQLEIRMAYPDDSQMEFYQMIFVLSGQVRVTAGHNNSTFAQIAAQQHNICRATNPSARLLMSSVKDEVICINLSAYFLNKYLPVNHPAHNQLTANKHKEAAAVTLSPYNMPITPEVSSILQRLGTLGQGGLFDQLLLESKVIELLALQISQFEQVSKNTALTKLKEGVLAKMLDAREILIHHSGDQLSLKSLALKVGTNEFNLKRDFKTVFGNTVYGYLNQHKMELAKSMLVQKEYTIAEISEKVGYKHATHFSSAFKKFFGYLPNKIRSGKFSLLLFADEFLVGIENLGCLLGF